MVDKGGDQDKGGSIPFMTTYFIDGTFGTLVGFQCWKYGGWHTVTWQYSFRAFYTLLKAFARLVLLYPCWA